MQNEVFILDSNIWISYLLTRRIQILVSIILKRHLTVLTSEQLVQELQSVLARPKFKKYVNLTDIEELSTLHLKLCRFVVPKETITTLSDPKDNFLINLYLTGKATVLVSGDKELLREATALDCRVMTLKEFELLH